MGKKIKVFCIFIVLFTLIAAGTAWAGEEKSVTLLYTGNLLGQVTPRHG